MMKKLIAASLALLVPGAWAEKPAHLDELADLSLEQLANITVSSASRRAEPVLEALASVYVITSEDIRRSGAVTLYDALRLAPNLQVLSSDASQAIATARGGFFGTANKMLMLIDGRQVYTPLFSGVFSDAQDVVLEDVERIEAISGPGSTLWGTNAVNGVINVVTKSAARTQGTLVAVQGGDEYREATLRHGAALAGGGFYRAYVKYNARLAHMLETGATARDDAERWQAGFRADWEARRAATTVQGDVYGANVGNIGGARPLSGGNLRGRWTWSTEGGSDILAQAYYDRTEREHVGSFKESRDIGDIEVQHALRHGNGQRFVWGGEYRVSRDRTADTPSLGFVPASRVLRFPSLYMQEEHGITDKLRVTAGVRAERNDFTGTEWLPNLRLAYSPSADHLAWGALTRTVRAPSRLERDAVVPGMPPFLLNPGSFGAETADVAELGWRSRIASRGSVSLTTFHHRFRDLRTAELVAPGRIEFTNAGRGRISGVEGWGDFLLHKDWKLIAGFVALRTRFQVEPGHTDLEQAGLGNNPRRTALLRSLWNPTASTELDVTVRHVGELPTPVVPAYTLADVRAGWHVHRDLEVSVLVANVFDKRHVEIGAAGERAVFQRGGLVKVTWTGF